MGEGIFLLFLNISNLASVLSTCIILLYRTPTCDGYIDDIYQFLYPGIGANLMYMALEGIVLMFIIILIEVHNDVSAYIIIIILNPLP